MPTQIPLTHEVPLSAISPNPQQPRTHFDQAKLEELTASIRIHGVILPISLEEIETPLSAGGEGPGVRYYLEDGERRWRAASMAGLTTIPATINFSRNGTGSQARIERALVANIQREDMNPIELGHAYRELNEVYGLTQIQIAVSLGKDPQSGQAHVSNHILLTRLDPEIQNLIAQGKFNSDAAVARALLKIPDSAARIKLVKRLIAHNAGYKASLHAARKLADALTGKPLPNAPPPLTNHLTPENLTPDLSSPALTLGKLKARFDPDEPKARQQYDALVHTGNLPMWPGFKAAVSHACRKCAWQDHANASICGGCPVVDVVNNVLNKAKE
jgi:ParB family chromosome partitioning protein